MTKPCTVLRQKCHKVPAHAYADGNRWIIRDHSEAYWSKVLGTLMYIIYIWIRFLAQIRHDQTLHAMSHLYFLCCGDAWFKADSQNPPIILYSGVRWYDSMTGQQGMPGMPANHSHHIKIRRKDVRYWGVYNDIQWLQCLRILLIATCTWVQKDAQQLDEAAPTFPIWSRNQTSRARKEWLLLQGLGLYFNICTSQTSFESMAARALHWHRRGPAGDGDAIHLRYTDIYCMQMYAHYPPLCYQNFPQCVSLPGWSKGVLRISFAFKWFANAISARGLGQQRLLVESHWQSRLVILLGTMVRFDPEKQGMLAAVAPEQHGGPKQT